MKIINLLLEKLGKQKLIALCCVMAVITVASGCLYSRCEHTYDNACDAVCNECGEERTVEEHNWVEADCDTPKTCSVCSKTEGDVKAHTPSADDGNCLTAITCKDCGAVTTPAREAHTPNEDDGDCTTAVLCMDCGLTVVEGNQSHTPSEDDKDCTTAVTCEHCDYVFVEALSHSFNEAYNATHEAHWYICLNEGCDVVDGYGKHYGEDDGDCTTWVLCECGWLVKEANEAHVSNEDDGDCTTAVTCEHCDYVFVEALSHSFNEAYNATHEAHWYICLNEGCDVVDGYGKHYGEDDGDCTTWVLCECGWLVKEAKEHLLEEYVDNGNGTHSLKCKNCDYKDSVEIDHYDYFNGDCECDKCGALHYLPHIDDDDCTCYICHEEVHSFNEECVCEVCQITYHDVDPSTGICLRCNNFEASASITVEGEKNYYATLLEAFTAAGVLNNCTVVLENDVFTDTDNLKNITQGSFTIDLSGKTIDKAPYMGSSYVFVNGASVTIKDSVGGGKITALQLKDGIMNIENGLFGEVFLSGGVCTVVEGEFDLFSATTGSNVQIAGGSYKEIEVYKTVGTLDTLLTEGYCFYDTQGNAIDISSIEQVNGWHEIVNVTVNEVQ